jgi:hypothetical protein
MVATFAVYFALLRCGAAPRSATRRAAVPLRTPFAFQRP